MEEGTQAGFRPLPTPPHDFDAKLELATRRRIWPWVLIALVVIGLLIWGLVAVVKAVADTDDGETAAEVARPQPTPPAPVPPTPQPTPAKVPPAPAPQPTPPAPVPPTPPTVVTVGGHSALTIRVTPQGQIDAQAEWSSATPPPPPAQPATELPPIQTGSWVYPPGKRQDDKPPFKGLADGELGPI